MPPSALYKQYFPVNKFKELIKQLDLEQLRVLLKSPGEVLLFT